MAARSELQRRRTGHQNGEASTADSSRGGSRSDKSRARGVGVTVKRCQATVSFICAAIAILSTALLIGTRTGVPEVRETAVLHDQSHQTSTRDDVVSSPLDPGQHTTEVPRVETRFGEQPSNGLLTMASKADIRQIARGTSVYCNGDTLDSRRCHARNMCYAHGELVAVRGPETVLSGVPPDRFNPAVLTLGTVLQHNILHASFVDVPAEAMMNAPRVLLVRRPMLLMSRFMPSNIMHAIHDDVLPALATMQELGLDSETQAGVAFLDSHGWDSKRDVVYDALSPHPVHIDSLPNDSVVCFNSLHLGLTKSTTWYQYGFFSPQGPVTGTVDTRVVRVAAKTLSRRLGTPDVEPRDGWTVVLLTRSRNRLILNTDDLIAGLEARFNRNVVRLSMETHSVPELAKQLGSAGVVVGMHGSLLIGAAFLPRGAVLVELFPYGVPPEQYTPYRTAATVLGLQYVGWENLNESATTTHPKRSAALGGIAHLSVEQQRSIVETRRVPPHLCCTDPYWLFRIFSDTWVDVQDVVRQIPQPQLETAADENGALIPATSRGAARCMIVEQAPPVLRIEFERSWSAAFIPNLFYEVQVDELGQRWNTADPFITLDVSANPTVLNHPTLSVWVRSRTKFDVGRFIQTTCPLMLTSTNVHPNIEFNL